MAEDRAVLFGIDWAARWRTLVDERNAQVERLPRRGGPAGPGYWDRRAEEWRRLGLAPPPGDRFLAVLEPALTPDATVLDVGAGTGRYAFPMAARVRHVTAVEPSAGMRAVLEEEAARLGLRNVTAVPAAWEEAAVEPADVVVCSHVVYGVREMVPFLRKLERHARRAVYLSIRVSQFDQYVLPLWERIWGEPRRPEPGFIDLYNLLYALGVRANVALIPFYGRRTFASAEEAAATVADLLFLPEDRRPHPEVERYLREHLRPAEDGGLTWDFPPLQAAAVWWER
ncbi:MAG TPA: class I SAM-dependent methyltransferase [Dehalococcoidia bacterium]